MIHEILPVGPLQCNCSIIADEDTHEAMVIDPGDDVREIQAILQKRGVRVKQIVITHAHIDHVGGAMKLRAATGAPILLNQNDYALLKMLDVQAAWLGMKAPGRVDRCSHAPPVAPEPDERLGKGLGGSADAHRLATGVDSAISSSRGHGTPGDAMRGERRLERLLHRATAPLRLPALEPVTSVPHPQHETTSPHLFAGGLD